MAIGADLFTRFRNAFSAAGLIVRGSSDADDSTSPTVTTSTTLVPTTTEPPGSVAMASVGTATAVVPAVIGGTIGRLTSTRAVTNTVNTEQTFGTADSIEANRIASGHRIQVKWHGQVTASAGTDTLTIKVYVGNVVIYSSAAVDTAANDKFCGSFEGQILSAGASAKFYARGLAFDPAATTGTLIQNPNGGGSVDTTASVPVKITATWSATTATNTATLDNWSVDLL